MIYRLIMKSIRVGSTSHASVFDRNKRSRRMMISFFVNRGYARSLFRKITFELALVSITLSLKIGV